VLLLLKTVAGLFFTWHWAACIYWFIADFEYTAHYPVYVDAHGHGEATNLWLPPLSLLEKEDAVDPRTLEVISVAAASFDLRYSHAFFWGVCVTTGIGWDIVPSTVLEVGFTTIMIIWGMLMYVTIIGGVTSIVSNMNSEAREQQQRLEKFNAYFRSRMVPKAIQRKIRQYFDFLWSGDISLEMEDGRDIMEALPKKLQMEVSLEVNRSLIESVPIFRGMRPAATFEVIQSLTRRVFIPEEFIIIEGRLLCDDMYLLNVGSVQVTFQGAELAVLGSGHFFGEICFLGRSKRRTATVKAVTYCDTMVLKRLDFEAISDQNPQLRQTMADSLQHIADRYGLHFNRRRPAPPRPTRCPWKLSQPHICRLTVCVFILPCVLLLQAVRRALQSGLALRQHDEEWPDAHPGLQRH
jgi:hypothetical protein